MKCPKCNQEIREGSNFCHNCGYSFNEEDTKKTPKYIAFLISYFPFILFFIVIVIGIITIAVPTFKMAAANYMEYDGIKIETMRKVLGKSIAVCSMDQRVDSDRKEFKLTYCKSFTSEDINEYINYMIVEKGYEQQTDQSSIIYKEVDNHEINIEVTSNKVKIEIKKMR